METIASSFGRSNVTERGQHIKPFTSKSPLVLSVRAQRRLEGRWF